MKKTLYAVCLVLGLVSLLAYCNKKIPLREDPIAVIGHGSVLDKEGKDIPLTEPFIEQVQDLYILQLTAPKLEMREDGVFDQQKISSIRAIIYRIVSNKLLANALFIDWLLEQRKPTDEAHYSVVNNTLRWYYVLKLQRDPILPDAKNRWGKGLPDDEAKEMEENGVIVYSITNSGMEAYCQECLEAGVPVPQQMFGGQWKNLGTFDQEFISESRHPELMMYVSSSPEGFCLALPRYFVEGGTVSNEAELFGVICMGTRTSKVCFFDNPRGVFYKRDEVLDFRTKFVGGNDLILNGQGVCSDCHAGENPYIIHPAKEAFMKIDDHVDSRFPLSWYDPLVPGTWPSNPGPTYLLDAISSTGKCNSCHRQGSSGGRFPDMSYPLRGYCNSVLDQAVRPTASGGTMPYGGVRTLFEPHINALQSYCGRKRYPGEVEPGNVPQDPAFLSPPKIIDPLYACAKQVAVRGAVLDAKVTLYINDVEVAAINPARNPWQINFAGIPELQVGDKVKARQEMGGAISDFSEIVEVRDFHDDYPTLPKPVIDPTTVYACAELIAVRHLPGAIVTVYTNGGGERSFGTGTDWTAIPPSGAPFAEGDEFTVKISMCGEESALSDPVRVRRAPTSLPMPTFNPPNIYQGQELITIETIEYGAKVTLRETGSGWTGSFSTPVTWFWNYDIKTAMGRAIRSGDNLIAMQSLCAVTGEWTPGGKSHDCQRLPAPLIETPIAGNNFVIVSQSVPGARVMIYDSGGTEIGDGSGTVIMLSRPLRPGERLTIVQRVGECSGKFVYTVQVTA